MHALELENQDLRKDVDKLEDALALHTSTKQADELSVKGIIRSVNRIEEDEKNSQKSTELLTK